MNDRLEDRLIDTLEHRAGDATDALNMADRAVAVGRRTQRRRRIVVVAVSASLVAAISIASAQVAQRNASGPIPSGPANSPTTAAEDTVKPTALATPSATETGPEQLIPAEAEHPAAGICGGNGGPIAVIEVNPDTPYPRCLEVRPDQRLKVVNTTNRFGFTGTTVVVTFGSWSSRTLNVGESVTFDQPLGTVFAPGVHTVHLDLQNFGYDYSAEIVVD
jgi:hypothetical protein